LRLLMLDASALERFPKDAAAAWRSFAILYLCLPAFLFSVTTVPAVPVSSGVDFYLFWVLLYVVVQTLFPLLLLTFTANHQMGEHVPAYIVVWNWVTLPATYISLTAGILATAGLLPDVLVSALTQFFRIYVLIVLGVAMCRVLKVSALTAFGIILAQYILDEIVLNWSVGRAFIPG